MFDISSLCSLEHTISKNYLLSFSYPWQSLKELREFIIITGESLDERDYKRFSHNLWIHKSVTVPSSAEISGPCIIGKDTQLRHCAFIRGSVIIGDGCVVGNSTEVKNSILFDGVQVPHYNYIGDSILGYKAHFGAAAVTSNVKSDKSEVHLEVDGEIINTEMKKFGAIVGDFAEIGCGSVLNPGTIIGRNTTVYPLTSLRGTRRSNCIVKGPSVCVDKYNSWEGK